MTAAPFIIDVIGDGNFNSGACDGKRISKADTLALPIGQDLSEIKLVAGFASELSYVTVTPFFTLRGTSAS